MSPGSLIVPRRRSAPPRSKPFAAAEGARRLCDVLRDVIDDSGVPRREIEKHLGLSRGALARLLGGRTELELRQLSGVLDLLGVPPSRFFREAFPTVSRLHRRGFARRLTVNADIVRIYVDAVEALRDLEPRLARCEAALVAVSRELAERGVRLSVGEGDRRVEAD